MTTSNEKNSTVPIYMILMTAQFDSRVPQSYVLNCEYILCAHYQSPLAVSDSQWRLDFLSNLSSGWLTTGGSDGARQS